MKERLGALFTELVFAAVRFGRCNTRRHCFERCYLPNPVVAAFGRELPVGGRGARGESVDLSTEATRWFNRS